MIANKKESVLSKAVCLFLVTVEKDFVDYTLITTY